MGKTTIDWPGLSKTINPIVGCSANCSYCYAKRINTHYKFIPDFSVPQFFHDRLFIPQKTKKPCTWFVGSMCDIFDKGVDIQWIWGIITMSELNPKHTFMFLTKHPERYREFKWPVNCWLGTTIEKGDLWGRMEIMRGYLPNKLFVSIEPILGEFYDVNFDGIDLVIVGADSTHGAKIPPLEWVKSIKHHNIWYKNNLRKHYPELKNKP